MTCDAVSEAEGTGLMWARLRQLLFPAAAGTASDQDTERRHREVLDETRRTRRATSLQAWAALGGVLVAAVGSVAAVAGLSSSEQDIRPDVSATPSVRGTQSGPPAKVAAVQREPSMGNGFTYVFADSREFAPEEIPNSYTSTQAVAEYEAWAKQQGAVDPETVSIKLVLEGNRDRPIRIIDLRPVKRCQPPLSGTLLFSPPQGSDDSVGILFDLDQARPDPVAADRVEEGENYFSTHTVSLKRGEQQTFQIYAGTARQYCEFSLQLTIVADGKTLTQTVDNHGQPFRVTALASCTGEPTCDPMDIRFASYKTLYTGGAQTYCVNGAWTREEPTTYVSTKGC